MCDWRSLIVESYGISTVLLNLLDMILKVNLTRHFLISNAMACSIIASLLLVKGKVQLWFNKWRVLGFGCGFNDEVSSINSEDPSPYNKLMILINKSLKCS